MAQPKKAERARKQGTGTARDDKESTLNAIRELVARSVMLPSDRIRDTLDDAVRRGRITREDAEDLLDRLVALGRQQTEDALTRLETMAGAPARAGRAVRKPPGTDRVLREVDRVRRSAGLGNAFPITNYDDLTAAQIVSRLGDLSAADLRKVGEYEKRNANRKSVLASVEKHLR